MEYIQGNTYSLEVKLREDVEDDQNLFVPIDNSNVERIQFVFGDIEKFYPEDVNYVSDSSGGKYIVNLTQEDTFKLRENIMFQMRVKYKDGQIVSTIPKYDYVYESITETRL